MHKQIALLLCLAASLGAQPYRSLRENARRDRIMQWAVKPDANACTRIQEGLTDPSADIRIRASNALYWKCDRKETAKTGAKSLCRSIQLGNAHAGAWLLLGYAEPETAKACLQKPIPKSAMVKLATSSKPVPATLAADVSRARLGDPTLLRAAFQKPSLDEALFLLAALREIDDPESLTAAIKLLDDNTRQAPGPDFHTTRPLRNVALEALTAKFQLKTSFPIDPTRMYTPAEIEEVRTAATQAAKNSR